MSINLNILLLHVIHIGNQFLEYLLKYSDIEKYDLINNMNNSLSSHNRHNTANINGNITPLDYKELMAVLL